VARVTQAEREVIRSGISCPSCASTLPGVTRRFRADASAGGLELPRLLFSVLGWVHLACACESALSPVPFRDHQRRVYTRQRTTLRTVRPGRAYQLRGALSREASAPTAQRMLQRCGGGTTARHAPSASGASEHGKEERGERRKRQGSRPNKIAIGPSLRTLGPHFHRTPVLGLLLSRSTLSLRSSLPLPPPSPSLLCISFAQRTDRLCLRSHAPSRHGCPPARPRHPH